MAFDSNQRRPLRLGEPAPAFRGHSTLGAVTLADYAGQWLVFFAHPADFTPVCTTEFVSFVKHAGDFHKLNCSLLGLSIDSVATHAAWRQSLQRDFGVSVDFPILADSSLEIARLYGMLPANHGGTTTVRALFIIDPRGILRAMLHYPCTTGRSVAEVLRLVQALQAADQQHALTPEAWLPGQATIAAPTETSGSAGSDADLDIGCVEWYCYRRPPASGVGRAADAQSTLSLGSGDSV